MDDLEKKFKELGRKEQEVRRLQQELARQKRKIKEELLAGATLERRSHYVELRLLPGRDPASKNPDDYDLVISLVS